MTTVSTANSCDAALATAQTMGCDCGLQVDGSSCEQRADIKFGAASDWKAFCDNIISAAASYSSATARASGTDCGLTGNDGGNVPVTITTIRSTRTTSSYTTPSYSTPCGGPVDPKVFHYLSQSHQIRMNKDRRKRLLW